MVGLCHIQGTGHKLAKYAGVPYNEMQWKCAGINHLAWFTELTHDGRDLYPILFEQARDTTSEFYESDPIRCDMMLAFGAFITESSGHLSEYIPYYRKRKDLIEKYARSGYREKAALREQLAEVAAANDENRRKAIAGEIEIKTDRSWEYASWIIEAHQTNRPRDSRQRHQLRPDRQPALRRVRRGAGDGRSQRLQPRAFRSLPPQMAASPRRHAHVRSGGHRGFGEQPGGGLTCVAA